MATAEARSTPERCKATLPLTRPRETEARIRSRKSDSMDSNSDGTPSDTSACLRFTELNSTVMRVPLAVHSPRP